MSESRMLTPGWVTDFRGENRVAPEHLLPASVAPEAINIDYLDGTIKKRPGLHRLHRLPFCTGSMLVSDARDGDRYARLPRSAPLNFGGTDPFEYELAMLFDQKVDPAASPTGLEFFVVDDMDGSDLTGVRLVLRWNGTNWRMRLYVGHSGGARATLDHTTNLSARTPYAVRIKHHPGANDFSLDVNGVVVNGNYGTETFVYNSANYINFGMSTFDFSPNGLRVLIDDFRIWNGDSNLPIIDASTGAWRQMTDAEVAIETGAGDLIAYYRFDEANASGDWESDGGTLTTTIGSVGDVVRGRALVLGARASVITGMIPVFGTATETDLLVCTEDSIYLLNYATGAWTMLHCMDIPSVVRWSFARHSRYILLSNGETPNLRYSTSGGVRRLSFEQPNSGLTATVSATGGSFSGAGIVKYLFSWYDNVSGQESFVYTTPISATLTAGTDKVTLSALPITSQIGVTHYRIYRTAVGGADYYYLTDVPYSLSATYVDDNTPDIDTSSIRSPYKGHAEPSLFLLQHLGYVFACNQDGATDRVRYSEPGTVGDFYFANTLRIGEDSGDELTGGVVAGGVPVLFKRNGIFIITGTGPSTFGVRKIADLPGCVHHATIGVSHLGVYYQSNDGVYLLPFPIGGAAPVDITENNQRDLFGAMRDDARREAYGVYDNVEQRYYTGLKIDSVRRSLTYDQRNDAWALWDLDADSFCIARPDGGVAVLLVARNGYVCRLDRTKMNDGVTGEDNAWTATTFTTTASTPSLGYINYPGTLTNKDTGGLLRNLRVKLTYPNGTSEYATVAYSDETRLWFLSAVGGVAGVIPSGAIVTIEPIAWNWRSPRTSFDGQLDETKSWHRFRAIFAGAGGVTLNAYVQGKDEDDTDAVQHTFDITTAARNWRGDITARGDEVIFGFSGESASAGFELCAFKLEYQERDSTKVIGFQR